jgi:hypothetical protein
MSFTKPMSSKMKRCHRGQLFRGNCWNRPDASRLSKVKFITTFETDLVRPALDRKHAAHLIVTAPKSQRACPEAGFVGSQF